MQRFQSGIDARYDHVIVVHKVDHPLDNTWVEEGHVAGHQKPKLCLAVVKAGVQPAKGTRVGNNVREHGEAEECKIVRRVCDENSPGQRLGHDVANTFYYRLLPHVEERFVHSRHPT